MEYIKRDKSLITNKENLEHLYTFKNFPVFMGCVDTIIEQDLFADMQWDICPDTGFIQLHNLLPLDILYLDQHNDGTGKVWQDHYVAFVNFLKKYKSQNILEIGGAHDFIASRYLDVEQDASWTVVEPNPQNIKDVRVKVIKGWFGESFKIDDTIDTIVHSHVFEHVYDPFDFIKNISSFLQEGDKHIFSFPNLLPMLEKKYTNCLNFEHTFFMTEYFADYVLEKSGFKILEKSYFGDSHSIFYSTQKISDVKEDIELENKYEEYKGIFMDFVNYHKEIINDLNEKIEKSSAPVYLFGGHIFSQFLLSFGLNSEKIECILDNSPIKQEKRLYGTRFMVKSPDILKDKGEVNVILRAGSYNDEISKQLLTINNKINIW